MNSDFFLVCLHPYLSICFNYMNEPWYFPLMSYFLAKLKNKSNIEESTIPQFRNFLNASKIIIQTLSRFVWLTKNWLFCLSGGIWNLSLILVKFSVLKYTSTVFSVSPCNKVLFSFPFFDILLHYTFIKIIPIKIFLINLQKYANWEY